MLKRLIVWIGWFLDRNSWMQSGISRLNPSQADLLRRICAPSNGSLPIAATQGATAELRYAMIALVALAPILRFYGKFTKGNRVLYVGHSYYHTWYLAQELRKKDWVADTLNWNDVPGDQLFFHGHDFAFTSRDESGLAEQWKFYVKSLFSYDIFHFSNAHAMHYGHAIHEAVQLFGNPYDEVRVLKALGKTIVYSNNSCHDGVSQSSFRAWETPHVCDLCNWRDQPSVCSDEVNLKWGELRNSLADYQCCFGANRADYNDDEQVNEVPQFYCLDKTVWHPQLDIPEKFRINRQSTDDLLLYHAVGNFDMRTGGDVKNIKSTHVYVPLVEQLKDQGYPIDFLFFNKVPNRDLRFYQAQADIFLDMLSFGWFGATGREALMLGKPVICYLRPSWIEQVREHVPGYVEECPVVSATPETVREVLVDLIENPQKREELGRKGRDFALKWHSSEKGAEKFDQIYSKLVSGR